MYTAAKNAVIVLSIQHVVIVVKAIVALLFIFLEVVLQLIIQTVTSHSL